MYIFPRHILSTIGGFLRLTTKVRLCKQSHVAECLLFALQMGGQLQSVLKALRLFDYNRDGQIQKHELRRVIENFCFRLSDEQFNK